MNRFSPAVRSWFESNFAASTRVQSLGWPVLAAGRNGLLIAPTGSGKTLAAFLWALDRLGSLPEDAERGVRVLYVSPLKALVYDIERNLRAPLVGIQRAAERLGEARHAVRVDVRTGDTAQRDRRRQVRDPGEILVTTPESLFLLLGSRAAETLRTVDTIIVDEIHVFAPTKRGAHLALSLERLAEIAESDPQRIGLSATVRPPDAVARFLAGRREVEVVDASERAHVALRVTVPVPDMDDVPRSVGSDSGGSILGRLAREAEGGGWPRGAETSGLWPQIYPRLLDLILEHRSTLIFVNSRGLCERLSQRLNDLYAERTASLHKADDEEGAADVSELVRPDLVRAHHGSVSHEKRADVEEALKAGRLRAIVATSSLELGIDMGAIDLVVLIESPGSVARGLQRVGRAGHSVGEISQGVIFPKFKGDLLECAVVSRLMGEGTLEPIEVPRNPLDVLAQQIVAACCDRPRTVAEIEQLVRRAEPFRELPGEVLHGVLDMLSGRYPSHELADLRPNLVWDRGRDLLSPRRGAAMMTRLNAGTIPDRGLFAVHLGEEGPRLGELDEEMVYETRTGDTFLLGASTWRVIDITRDRVLVQPAPGEPGRMPFWRGEGPGRPIHLGRALGAFLRELTALDEEAAAERLRETTPLDENAIVNLLGYLTEQRAATGVVPSDRVVVVERFRDELGDWRVCLLTPFGARVHGPWAMALERLIGERAGFEVEAMATDDGIVLRFADTEELPDASVLFPDPDEVEDLIVDQVGSSALFASRFRENAARALLLPRNRPGKRSPLWQQRLRAKSLLAAVQQFRDFPIVLETYRECLRDVFDVPALIELLRSIERREVRVEEAETTEASPFARSLVYAYVANYLYEQDSPVAERKAQALTLDRNLLRELLGHSELRELLDAQVIEQVEEDLQRLSEETRARDADELADLLRRVGDLDEEEAAARCEVAPGEEGRVTFEHWLDRLLTERRACAVQIAGRRRWIGTDDVALYRDALGIQPPSGLPDALLEARATPLEDLLARFAATHGPFVTERVASRFGLTAGQVEPVLKSLVADGRLVRGEIRPGGSAPEWCDAGVLRRIKRATLAKLRGEVAPVGAEVLARFLPRWQGLERISDDSTLEVAAGRKAPPRRTVRRGSARVFGGKRVGSLEAQLDEALAQLEGYPLPWSALSQHVLPARVDGFRVEQLDLRAASGELVWVGCSPIGGRDGKVALYRRDRAAVLLTPPPEALDGTNGAAHTREVHAAILDHLRDRGASFTFELERLAALRGRDAREVQAAIWDLVWGGLVTNDTFRPLVTLGSRSGAADRRSAPAAGLGSRAARSRTVRRPATASRFASRSSGTLAGGRWSMVSDLIGEGVSETERVVARVSQLAERYGLVSREAALAEEVPGGFQALLPVLRELEEAGRMRRGYFVEGLAGRQYALPGAIELLRREREGETAPRLETGGGSGSDDLSVLAAVDPACPWGALLPWPPGRREDGPRPRRVAGAWVVLRRGVPLCFVDAGGRSLVTFSAARALDQEAARVLDQEAARVLAEGLLRVAQEGRRRSVRLTRIDGEPASSSSVAPRLLAAGFVAESTGLRLSR
ncbi:MAG TPA: DEAD/DEAH box helicase [Thermoanaerobaculia bacterium]|nr:DEAD/DEAH box helicase [Thermoanaerobaculia bacterium]